jgi:adenosylcobinamide-phosphate synthase
MTGGRAWAIPLALAIDGVFGEPPSWLHPVVWIGTVIAVLERRAPRAGVRGVIAGAALTGVTVGGSALAGCVAARLIRYLPWPLALLAESWLFKTMLSVRALLEAGQAVERSLSDHDLPRARFAVRSLVSRDPSNLSQERLTSAVIESLAENTADSIVAPLMFYATGGLPAAFAYRAANTLDAMIGYRGEYEHLGKVAARLDDVLNLLPARFSSALLLGSGAVWGGTLPTGLAVTLRDHGNTASPNAGWPMSTMAGLLFTRLEKPGHYVLGDDLLPPDLPAIDHAGQLVFGATLISVPATLLLRSVASRIVRRCWNGGAP